MTLAGDHQYVPPPGLRHGPLDGPAPVRLDRCPRSGGDPRAISSMKASRSSQRGLSDVGITPSPSRAATSPTSGRLAASRSPPHPNTTTSLLPPVPSSAPPAAPFECSATSHPPGDVAHTPLAHLAPGGRPSRPRPAPGPTDRPDLTDVFRHLSPASRRQRFLSTSSDYPSGRVEALTSASRPGRYALVAALLDPPRRPIIAIAEFVTNPPWIAEPAITVLDAYQDHRLGTRLSPKEPARDSRSTRPACCDSASTSPHSTAVIPAREGADPGHTVQCDLRRQQGFPGRGTTRLRSCADRPLYGSAQDCPTECVTGRDLRVRD